MASNSSHPFNTYLRRLANLSSNNRCLFLPRLKSDQFIDLYHISQLQGEVSFSIVEAAIQQKKKKICARIDSRLTHSNEISKKLRRLQRADQFLYEERGVRDLHIGWPFVRGKFLSDSHVRCPLLMIPVDLSLHDNNWVLQRRKGTHITFNKFFLLAYYFHHNVPIDESMLEETFEGFEKESLVFRTKLYERLKESIIDLHFNADNYRDTLTPFKTFLTNEFDEIYEGGKLKLFPEAVLGIFPQSGSYLAPDYLSLMKSNEFANIEALFLSKNQIPQQALHRPSQSLPPPIAEKDIFFGYDQDVWQESILRDLKNGLSLIVKGPPGTGKSQLICNIICDALATRKKILVVCQKRAALDVIYQRMETLRLTDFLSIVHDFKNDRKTIYAKAARQIDRIEEYTAKNNSLDAIQLDRAFTRACNRIDQISAVLDDLKKALFDEHECGLSAKELYLRSNPKSPAADLTSIYRSFTFDTIDTFISKLNAYSHYAQRFERDNYPWKERKSFAALRATDIREIETIVPEVHSTIKTICDDLHKATGHFFDWGQCLLLAEKSEEICKMLVHIKDESAYRYFRHRIGRSKKTVPLKWLLEIEKEILMCFEEGGPEVSLSSDQLARAEQTIKRGIKMHTRFAGALWWRFFSNDRRWLKKTFRNNRLHSDKYGCSILIKKLSKRIKLERLFAALKKYSELTDLPKSYDTAQIKEWFGHQKNAVKAAQFFWETHNTVDFMASHKMQHDEIRDYIAEIPKAVSLVPAIKKKWGKYLSDALIASLASDLKKCDLANSTIRQDFNALRELDTIKAAFSTDENKAIHSIYTTTRSWENLSEVFMNSLALAWIDHIETKYPALSMVSSDKLKLLESELSDLIAVRKKISHEIALMHAREEVMDNLQFNRLNNRITYRDLRHQLTKKKKIWPLRKLLAQFEKEMLRLLPCWLASPESVSAIFPLKEMFDIIIFDEASQCFAEQSIPAIYRGRQVMIAGDDKQLRPNDLYRIRWQEEETDNADLDANSLLELATQHLKQSPLKSHYRSKSPELIDFSNRHFYDGQLTCIPHFKHYVSAAPPILYHQVEGIWEKNINNIEAVEVVNIVVELIQENPEKDIGIVTFNAPQQMLIMDRLEEVFAEKKVDIPTSLIVKNIENVQGDEKDIIIFSVGYATNKARKLKSRFGSLNKEGGENRLNVAITRAREKVIIVTSIQPHQLHVDDTLHAGPKLFKKYLQYAKDVSEGKFKPVIPSTDQNKLTLRLSDKIKSWGRQQNAKEEFIKNDIFSFADLSVDRNNNAPLLLFTDDELYHQSPSAKDYHFSTPHILMQKKWKPIHLYSRNYWQDKRHFFDRLKALIAEKKDTPSTQQESDL